jgi:hypothetical protein
MTSELDARSPSRLHASEVPGLTRRARGAKRTLAVLLGSFAFAAGLSHAAPHPEKTIKEPASLEGVEMSEPLRTAVLLAKAAGGGVGFVGTALALDEAAAPAEVAIIQPVAVERMKTGEIVMLVTDDCKSPTGCLLARRIVEKRGSDVATRRYGRPTVGAGKEVEASVVGRVAYAVDLTTGRIRDMRRDDTKEVSLAEALRRESKKWHYVGNSVRPRPFRI